MGAGFNDPEVMVEHLCRLALASLGARRYAPTVKRKEGAAITGGLTISCRWADAGGADVGAAGDEAAALSAEVEELKAKVEQLDADKAQCVPTPSHATAPSCKV